MKKILFSLAALAALSMVAVGCKKASDVAQTPTKMIEITTVKKAFNELKASCYPAKCTKKTDVAKICKGNGCLLTKFGASKEAAKKAGVTGVDAVKTAEIEALTAGYGAALIDNDNDKKDKVTEFQGKVKTLEDKMNALKVPAALKK